MIRIGTAGWTIPRHAQSDFDPEGSHLARYAQRLDLVEINSSFYRPHRRSTWERWAATVPPTFRFAVKLPKTITHEARLVGVDAALDRFVDDAGRLGDRWGVLLVQLPPSLRFEARIADAFFVSLGERYPGFVACEPRHASWFEKGADTLLFSRRVARVAADPAPVPAAAHPGGCTDAFVYYRWHGSPRIYRSAYDDPWLDAHAVEAAAWSTRGHDVWCVFDNTAAGAALPDALRFRSRCGAER